MLRPLLIAVLTGAVAAASVVALESPSQPPPQEQEQPSPRPQAAPSHTTVAGTSVPPEGPSAAAVHVEVDGQWSWALRNMETGELMGAGSLRNTTESMIKAWLAVDYVAAKGSVVSSTDELLIDKMIRSSNDNAAQTLYLRLGADASVRRMITTCGLRTTSVHAGWWSLTTMPASDATLLGACVARGPGMSPEWRDKLLDKMRNLSPGNGFGIAEAPAFKGRQVAVKNGWTLHGTTWAVNCLGIWDQWVLAVMIRYHDRGDEHLYGAGVCSTIAQQLFASV
ncbi:serine hydrolase [Lentzea sp. E54]|uniref:serine hydrolase n=1 Tax=Lentzea xerophila TaxID=3435883 RepID=UPI003DA55E50